MKKIKYILGLFLTLSLLVGCEEENYEFGEIITPSSVEITAQIVGQDADNPNGDGSGLVNFTATAENEITFKFDFGDGFSGVNNLGQISHQFTKVGVNSYTVVVNAIGTGGITTSTAISLDVFSNFEDQEAKDFLSGGPGNSTTWYWAADKPGNIGLGPNEVMGDGSHTYPAWFSSDAWHADKLCMYDAEFEFSQSADGVLNFEQKMDIAYIPGGYAATIGVDGDICHGSDVVPSLSGIKEVALAPASSIATNDGTNPEYRGTSMNFSDGGFMCWYVGNSNFEIIEITSNSLYVRVTEPGFAWYCKFQTQDPNG